MSIDTLEVSVWSEDGGSIQEKERNLRDWVVLPEIAFTTSGEEQNTSPKTSKFVKDM